MPKIMNFAESGLRQSPHFLPKKSKLMPLVTGAAVLFSGVENTVFPTIDGKEDLFVAQRCAHRYHTMNSNVDATNNGVLQPVFSTVVNNDAYTFGGMLKQPDAAKFVEAMLVKTAVQEKQFYWSTLLEKYMPAGAKTIMSIWSFKQK